jgi:hypothetical protein
MKKTKECLAKLDELGWAVIDEDGRVADIRLSRKHFNYLLDPSDRMARVRIVEVPKKRATDTRTR